MGRRVRGLGHVPGVDVGAEGGVVHVSFEGGGKAEEEEIERAIREAAG